MLTYGRGRWVVTQNRITIQNESGEKGSWFKFFAPFYPMSSHISHSSWEKRKLFSWHIIMCASRKMLAFFSSQEFLAIGVNYDPLWPSCLNLGIAVWNLAVWQDHQALLHIFAKAVAGLSHNLFPRWDNRYAVRIIITSATCISSHCKLNWKVAVYNVLM